MKEKNKQTLTRSSIRDAFHQKLEINQEEASNLLESILSELSRMIIKSSSVKIVSFGTFLIHNKKERIGRNPKTKIEVPISPRKSVTFRASAFLKDQVEKGPKIYSEGE